MTFDEATEFAVGMIWVSGCAELRDSGEGADIQFVPEQWGFQFDHPGWRVLGMINECVVLGRTVDE